MIRETIIIHIVPFKEFILNNFIINNNLFYWFSKENLVDTRLFNFEEKKILFLSFIIININNDSDYKIANSI